MEVTKVAQPEIQQQPPLKLLTSAGPSMPSAIMESVSSVEEHVDVDKLLDETADQEDEEES